MSTTLWILFVVIILSYSIGLWPLMQIAGSLVKLLIRIILWFIKVEI